MLAIGLCMCYCNDTFQVLIVSIQLLLSVVQLVHQLVDLLTHLTIPYVTEFAKRGLIHTSNFSTLRMCNSASAGPTALKLGSKTFLSLY